ncbi:hypothetical protein PGTUg99_004539 [Puccinia graminis f. sp. tritici]|uniref:Uncharacterized protein n=1 Tax=Puccinia graminis f. sp. tritici TaxID=56615 RepID=A0A5B0SIJ4_PUCGR|nr:hypothetical protein PGTUg99_004539 [Puccinia graminis f. sp. tritici]
MQTPTTNQLPTLGPNTPSQAHPTKGPQVSNNPTEALQALKAADGLQSLNNTVKDTAKGIAPPKDAANRKEPPKASADGPEPPKATTD